MDQDWLMTFHPDKCTALHTTKKEQHFKHNYILHNHKLETLIPAKYLIKVQSNSKWDKLINDVTSKGKKTIGFLKRNLKMSNLYIKTQAYQVLVPPTPGYSSTAWDPHSKESKSKIEMVQKRAARCVCNRYHNTSKSDTDMLENINLLPLSHRRPDIFYSRV